MAFASKGAVNYVMGSTSTKPDYTTIPVTETLNKKCGLFTEDCWNNFQTAIHLKADITEKISSMLTKKTEQKKSINHLWLIMKKTVTKLC